MRIKAITPIHVGEVELARRQERYRALAPPSLDVVLFDLPGHDKVPKSLESEAEIRTSECFVVEESLATDPGSYDALLPDCVLDPGLDLLKRESPIPAFGILELSAGFLFALGRRFASVTRNRPIGEEFRSRLGRYGHASRFDGNVVMDLGFADIADETRWNEALAGVVGRFAGSPTTAVINGCSAVELEDHASGGVALVDPTRLALRLLGTVADTGLLPRSEEALRGRLPVTPEAPSDREAGGPDLVVVGAGACGMVAAVAAAKRGLEVLILDKGDEPAGNTARSTGLIPAAGTRFQQKAGIPDDTPDLMARDILGKNHHESDPEMTRLLCEQSGPLVEWLADEVGCEMVCFTDFLYPGHSRLRMHGPPTGYGTELVAALQRAVRSEPRIDLLTGTPALGLEWNGERVTGVRTGDGVVGAGVVVLAPNGFGANREMVRQHLGPQVAGALYYGSPHNTGEGIAWGTELGAATAHMGAYQGHASVAHPDGPLVTWGVIVNGAILVNRQGRRFGDEMVGYSEFAADVLAQPGGEAWEIFDREVYEASRGTRLEEVITADKVQCFDSLEEMCAAFGLPIEALKRTVEETNRCARSEAGDPFGRAGFAGGPLEPPFYGIHVVGALFHTQGGLVVDERARVLRPDGTAIPGLYAGGGTAVGISGSGHAGYSSGNGLLAAAVLGKIAGENAAPSVRAR